jgi:hypothetical protein
LLEIKEVLDAYLNKASEFSDQNVALKARLMELLSVVECEDHVKESSEVMTKLAKYIKLKLKIQHMSLIRAMYHLQRYKSAKEIPSLIFAVRNDVPGVLLNHSRIKKVVLDTVAEVKGPLLVQFHKLLEDHLVAAQKDSSADSAGANSTLWTAFLTQARDSLLAFTMVSLLPTVLTETSGMILEKFQDTLDEALTPTWGRYHYHLQVAIHTYHPLSFIFIALTVLGCMSAITLRLRSPDSDSLCMQCRWRALRSPRSRSCGRSTTPAASCA